jgi:hypothetical protein
VGRRLSFRNSKLIEYVTISSTGNSLDFGDRTTSQYNLTALSNATRGIFAGGHNPTNTNIIDYVTMHLQEMLKILEICKNKNTDLTVAHHQLVEYLLEGGYTSHQNTIIDYITIQH